MKKKSINFFYFTLLIFLLNCKKSSIEKQVTSSCSSSNFGVSVDKGQVLCATASEILPNINKSGELEMFYMFNNCCAAIYFTTSNFQKNGVSNLIIHRFGTPDDKIKFNNRNSKDSNGKIKVLKIKGNKLTATFSATFEDDNSKKVNIEGSFNGVTISGL